jgi:hypothetical protein
MPVTNFGAPMADHFPIRSKVGDGKAHAEVGIFTWPTLLGPGSITSSERASSEPSTQDLADAKVAAIRFTYFSGLRPWHWVEWWAKSATAKPYRSLGHKCIDTRMNRREHCNTGKV